MTTYVIGDVHGCYRSLLSLLEAIHYNPDEDELLFLGDLVNKGPSSLEVLKLVRSLPKAKSVLGNHEFHLLLAYDSYHEKKSMGSSKCLQPILEDVDSEDLIHWVRSWPLVLYEKKHHALLFHAAVDPVWKLDDILKYSAEVSEFLGSDHWRELIKNKNIQQGHRVWRNDFTSMDRLYTLVNIITRGRYWSLVDQAYDFHCILTPGDQPISLLPWYELKRQHDKSLKLIFGHWASLKGSIQTDRLVALDGGCVWGGKLLAYNMTTNRVVSVEVLPEEVYERKKNGNQ